MFNFKFNIKIMRNLLLLTILTFFLPFFAVSCGSEQLTFSGFELSYTDFEKTNLNYLGFTLILMPIVMFILSFQILFTKNARFRNVCKIIFIVAPIFNLFAVFIVKYALKAYLLSAAKKINLDIIISTDIKYGFVLYIILNALVFILASVNYLFISDLSVRPKR